MMLGSKYFLSQHHDIEMMLINNIYLQSVCLQNKLMNH